MKVPALNKSLQDLRARSGSKALTRLCGRKVFDLRQNPLQPPNRMKPDRHQLVRRLVRPVKLPKVPRRLTQALHRSMPEPPMRIRQEGWDMVCCSAPYIPYANMLTFYHFTLDRERCGITAQARGAAIPKTCRDGRPTYVRLPSDQARTGALAPGMHQCSEG